MKSDNLCHSGMLVQLVPPAMRCSSDIALVFCEPAALVVVLAGPLLHVLSMMPVDPSITKALFMC